MGIVKEERIGGQRLILGDCLAVMPLLGRFDHVICDPPYEQISQDRIGGIKRNDGGKVTAKLSFAGIDRIRDALASKTAATCDGWAIFFCTSEGVALWRDQIEAAGAEIQDADDLGEAGCHAQIQRAGTSPRA